MEEGNFEVKCASIIIWPWVKYKMFVYVKMSWISSTEGTIQPQSNEKISRYSLCLWPLISKDAWALVSASLCDPTLLYLCTALLLSRIFARGSVTSLFRSPELNDLTQAPSLASAPPLAIPLEALGRSTLWSGGRQGGEGVRITDPLQSLHCWGPF